MSRHKEHCLWTFHTNNPARGERDSERRRQKIMRDHNTPAAESAQHESHESDVPTQPGEARPPYRTPVTLKAQGTVCADVHDELD